MSGYAPVKVFMKKVRRKLRKLKNILMRYPQTKKKNRRNPNSENARVIVSGRNYSSNLCMARALGKAGYEVEILRIFRVRPRRRNILAKFIPDAFSKYVKAFHVCVSRDYEVIANKLIRLADPNRKMLLIPADDFVAEVIDTYYDDLSPYYIMPNIGEKAGGILHMMSKVVQKELATEAGLPVINSCLIQSDNGQFEIPDSVSYPCFIKPDVSPEGLKSKMCRCDTEEELRRVLAEMSDKKNVSMLVQDYIEIEREYSILGISTKHGAIGPGFFRAEEGGHDGRRGVAVEGRVIPAGKYQELVDKIVDFVGTLNFDGLYDVDLIETKDGKMYFVELNMRFGGSGYAITESGVNLPAMYADYMLCGKPIDQNFRVEETGKVFVSEKMMMEEYSKGYLSVVRMREILKNADIRFIYDREDPRPYKHFRFSYLIATLMRMILK